MATDAVGGSEAGSPVRGEGLGALLQAWRERALLTQERLAERAGVSVRTVRRLESDDTGRPRGSSLELLATALELSGSERGALLAAAGGGSVEPVGDGSGRSGAVGSSSVGDVPRQLPAPPPAFTGRVVELAGLERVRDAAPVVITSIDGMAGVGKTALAVHAAHQLAGHYPDGQLFLDLHGWTEGVAPVEPDEALKRMLRALGVSAEQIPPHLDDRAALFRSSLADRKVLILLDNAASEAQVAPLLPGMPGCLVMVTSRRRLVGLDAAQILSLDVLPPRDAVALFTGTLGDDRRAAAAPEMLAEVVELCGRLPLAIRIAAVRLRTRPGWTASHLVERLREHRRSPVELEAGSRSVTATLDLSYRQLDPSLQRVFRLLGLHPGGDLDVYAVAALAGATLDTAERWIDGLLEAHLLQEPAPGRFRFHDLIRTYAAGTAAAEEAEPERGAALARLLDHYCRAASLAMDVVYPYERERRPAVWPAESPSPALGDETAAAAWLDVELPNLLAAAQLAADHGWLDHIRHLSATLHRRFRNRGGYTGGEVLHNRVLATARSAGHRRGEAEALVGLGNVYRLQGRMEPAWDNYRQGLAAARASHHRTAELDALLGLGHMSWFRYRHELAAAHYDEAGEIARITGNRNAEMEVLIGLGWVRFARGQGPDDEFGRALELARALGHRLGEILVLQAFGYVHRLHGRYEQAINAFQRELDIARAIGSRDAELGALVDLCNVYRLSGHTEHPAETYRQALGLAREVESPVFQVHTCDALGRLHHTVGRADLALVHHQLALDLAMDLDLTTLQAHAHDGLAHALIPLNQPDQAREHWKRALDILASRTAADDITSATIRDSLDQLDRPVKAQI